MREKTRKQRIRQIQNKVKNDKYVVAGKEVADKTVEGVLSDINKK